MDDTLNEPVWYSRAPDSLKKSFAWIMATGQTIRWATQEVVLRDILGDKDIRTLVKDELCVSVDIGCGGGHYLIDLLAPLSKKATGFDINARNLSIAENRIRRQRLCDRAEALLGSAEDIPLPGGSVDLVLCAEVLEHLPNPEKALQEIKRLLHSNGRAILTIPIPPDPYPNPEHHADLTPSALERMLGDNGFTILEQRTCMYVISRAVLWLSSVTRFPLPLVPLCRLEQFLAGFISWPRPYGFICIVSPSPPGTYKGLWYGHYAAE
jgi:SAM-dependent methyltransferase